MEKLRIVTLLALLTIVVQPAAWGGNDGYRLFQRSDFYGDSVVEVSPDTLKIQSDKLGLKLLVTRPTFELHGVNDRSKQFGAFPFKHWLGFVLNAGMDNNSEEKHPYVLRGHSKICGVDVEEYWLSYEKRGMPDKSHQELWVNGQPYNTHLWTSKHVTPPRECFKLFAPGLGTPAELGMPLRMVQYSEEGRGFTTFDTVRVERCSVTPKLATPPEYKRAPDEMSLLMGTPDNTELASIFDDEDKPAKKRIRGWVPGMVYADNEGTELKPIAPKKSGHWVPGGGEG